MKTKTILIGAAIVLASILIFAAVSWGLTTLTENGSWTITEASFTLQSNPAFVNPRDLGIVAPADIKQITYTITNNGNTPIIVVVSASAVNAVATLNASSTGSLAVGASCAINLTLSGFAASGTYQITFNKA